MSDAEAETPQPETPPPRRTRKVAEPAPPMDTTLGPDFWGKMLDAHRQLAENSRSEHYASFRIA